ncbi:uncharacterized protein LOC135103123 [Scylla paramamosain]|uniref:uncharacterized protein LOC135103123 n=1 Tax=Scylla paramamosain TaxID=85552 RepID=UPI0030835E5A
MNTILDYPLHFPGSNTTLPWAQTGMSLAVVLVALMVLVLSCCGAAALFLAACCGNRRRDTVAESGDSRWLPGIGLIDYVPVSNRSSVRVSLVLSDSMQDLEGGADESHTPAISASHVSQQSPSRPQLYRAGAAASTQHLYTAAVSPEKDVRVSHSAEASPPRFVSQASVNSSEYNKDQELIEGDFKAALETAQQPINLIRSSLYSRSPPIPLHPLTSTTPSSLPFASSPTSGEFFTIISTGKNSNAPPPSSTPPPLAPSPPLSTPLTLLAPPPTSSTPPLALPPTSSSTPPPPQAPPPPSSTKPPPLVTPPPSLPAHHTDHVSLKTLTSPSQGERWSILPRLGHPNNKSK